jgi:hypothetical protein
LAVIHSNWPMSALWFPPYGNLGAQQAASEQKAAPVNYAEALKAHEDKVAEMIGNLGAAERAIAYKYLHAAGLRIGTADYDLRKAIRQEIGQKRE